MTAEKPIHHLNYVCSTNTPADLILQGHNRRKQIFDLHFGLITLSYRTAFNQKPFALGRAVSPLLSSLKQWAFSVWWGYESEKKND